MGDNNVPSESGWRLREEEMTEREKYFIKKIKSKFKNVNIELKTKDNGFQTIWLKKEEKEIPLMWNIPVADLEDKHAMEILIQDCQDYYRGKKSQKDEEGKEEINI